MNDLRLRLDGEPQAKARARFNRASGRAYNAQSPMEEAAREAIRNQLPDDFEVIEYNVGLIITAVFSRPKKHFGTGKNADLVKTSAPTYHTQKPDVDNIAKFYMDVLQGIVFADDAQVFAMYVGKYWKTANTPFSDAGVAITVSLCEEGVI